MLRSSLRSVQSAKTQGVCCSLGSVHLASPLFFFCKHQNKSASCSACQLQALLLVLAWTLREANASKDCCPVPEVAAAPIFAWNKSLRGTDQE